MKLQKRRRWADSSGPILGSCFPVFAVWGSLLLLLVHSSHAWPSVAYITNVTIADSKSKSIRVDKICPLEGIVEMVYNSDLDEYVYRDIIQKEQQRNKLFWWRHEQLQTDASGYDDEDYYDNKEIKETDNFTPKISAGLYRKCGCRTEDFPGSLAKNLPLDDGRVIDGANDESSSSPVAMLCPLEAQTCAVLYPEHEHDESSYHENPTTLCYTMKPRMAFIRKAWPILWVVFCLILLALLVSSVGWHALHYVIIRACGVCCCCCCCFNNLVIGQALNYTIVQRMLQAERLQRGQILREQTAISYGHVNRSDVTERRRRWWIFRVHRNNNDDGGGREDEERSEGNVDASWDPSSAGSNRSSSTNNTGVEFERRRTYAEVRRKHGIRQLALRTRIYKRARDLGNHGNDAFRECDCERATIADEAEQQGTSSEKPSPPDAQNGRRRTDKDFLTIGVDRTIACDKGGCGFGSGDPREADEENNDDDDDGGDEEDEDEDICIICFGTLEYGDKIGDLPHCDHIFHASCLKTWISRKNTCPMCLKPIAKPLY